jgi:hypothetical protein
MTKIEDFWENATAEDVARVMKGETVEARFWDDEHRVKFIGLLVGWSHGEPCWYCETACARSYFENCQVYREPSYWTNRPDPGPGYRLLGKLPDEPKLATDEAWRLDIQEWRVTSIDDGIQVEGVWYRRRIEPVEPEPKHCVLPVGDSVESPSGQLVKAVSPGVEQIEFRLKAGFKAKLPNGQTITATEKGFEVAQ